MSLRERIERLRAKVGNQSDLAEILDILESLESQGRRQFNEQSRMEARLARVENSAIFKNLRAAGRIGKDFVGRVGQTVLRSPFHPLVAKLINSEGKHVLGYEAWVASEEAAKLSRESQVTQSSQWNYQPVISILVPLYKPSLDWLKAAVASVSGQGYTRWQLCIFCDGPAEPEIARWLDQVSLLEPRIVLAGSAAQSGISSALNGASTLANGDYVTFLDQDDCLSLDALFRVVDALQLERPELLYSDEDWMSEGGVRIRPNFKPDWSPALLESCMYMGHLLVASRTAADQAGWFRSEFDGAQDYDFALRLVSQGATVRHIPAILYHWRMHLESTASSADAKPYAIPKGRAALTEYFDKRGVRTEVQPGVVPHTFINFRHVSDSAVSVIICSKSSGLLEKCLRSVQETTNSQLVQLIVVEHNSEPVRRVAEEFGAEVVSFKGEFNFSEMNNLGAAQAQHSRLLFLNDDVIAHNRSWLQSLVNSLEESSVAVVGAKLLYSSGAIQHAGMALAIGEGTGHIGRGLFASDRWRWLDLRRNVSAVTGACMAVKKAVFQELGGFDPVFAVNFNDADLCLRARQAGYEVIYDPGAVLQHFECASRVSGSTVKERELFWQRWADLLERPDPYFTPYLDGEELTLTYR